MQKRRIFTICLTLVIMIASAFLLSIHSGCGGGGGGDSSDTSGSTIDEGSDNGNSESDDSSSIQMGEYTGNMNVQYQVVENSTAGRIAQASVPVKVIIADPISISNQAESNPFHIDINPEQQNVYGYLQVSSAHIAPATTENPSEGIIEFWNYSMTSTSTFEGTYMRPLTNPQDNYLLSSEFNGPLCFNCWSICLTHLQKGATIKGSYENGELTIMIDGLGDGCALGSVLEFHAKISAK